MSDFMDFTTRLFQNFHVLHDKKNKKVYVHCLGEDGFISVFSERLFAVFNKIFIEKQEYLNVRSFDFPKKYWDPNKFIYIVFSKEIGVSAYFSLKDREISFSFESKHTSYYEDLIVFFLKIFEIFYVGSFSRNNFNEIDQLLWKIAFPQYSIKSI